ncbi:Ion channel [Caballeronia arationis]|jgi:hypothetical protein|uniref:Ion channel n=1 Tax=Caballeronia arationis TaxID=1777142 RepID=A0A7Z7IEC6_9BURK|nr:potassium channel family protein [Caballeronia arationis]SAL06741.1 Ion channel [Caballeronia arationis]SOE89059.1 Ion channel [Caballeronia arationis]
MVIRNAGRLVGRIFFQRCFYLFLVLMLFLCAAPFIEATPIGHFAINCVNGFIIVAAVASVGRTTTSFVLAMLLAGPALTYQWIAVSGADPHAVAKAWGFGALLYATTIGYLLNYVFRREVMTADKLFGAASAYLLLGVFWAFLYALVAHFYAGSFALFGQPSSIAFYDLVYFSFTVLTSTGFGDISPLSRQARGICVIEQIVGALFLAILIARLAGVYPPRERSGDNGGVDFREDY